MDGAQRINDWAQIPEACSCVDTVAGRGREHRRPGT